MKSCISINVVLFSISADIEKIKDTLRNFKTDDSVMLLSPHKVFDNEKECLESCTAATLHFKCFSDFISEQEMISCDIDADINICKSLGGRRSNLNFYYEEIKRLKNNVIINNLNKFFQVDKLFLFSEDLGIDGSVFRNSYDCIDFGLHQKKGVLPNIINLYKKTMKVMTRKLLICKIIACEREYYFIGNENRVLQYLSSDKINISKITYKEYFSLVLIYYFSFSRRLNSKIYDNFLYYLAMMIIRILQNIGGVKKISLMSAMHEYKDEIGLMARNMGVQYLNIQDGYLPSFYPSCYLRYRPDVTRYYCWDDVSADIFRYHELEYELWPAFKKVEAADSGAILCEKHQRILFLASGAGDWTALKNRSDEDLELIAFAELAKLNPDMDFVYRPHPMWVHPEHQGVSSIERVENYIKWCKVPNLYLSVNITDDAAQYVVEDNLSLRYKSVDTEINNCSIIFGDHSQTLLSALEKNKIIAGVELTSRSSFLVGHQKRGLPILKSVAEMQLFLDSCNEDSSGILNQLKGNLLGD